MVKKLLAAMTGLGLVFTLSATTSSARDYAHEIKAKKMTVAWSVEGDKLAMKMSAETEGWVGVGFNPSEKMKDADFVLGYVKKGKAEIVDEFGTGSTSHSPDEKQGGTSDAVLVGGTEEGGVTTIEFTIPLDSGDKNDKKIDPNGETIILMAFGAGRDSFKSKHSYRTEYKVNLGSGEATEID
jgi:uncharacterized cupredoxin-like copper-binding protein